MSATPLGRFCWFDLMTTEPQNAPEFYGAVVGWDTEYSDLGPEPYYMWTNEGTPIGGYVQLPDEAIDQGAPPHWLGYVSTPDLEATCEKAEALGGSVLMTLTIPPVGSFAVLRDPQNAVIAIFQPAGEMPGMDGPPGPGCFSWMELATDGWEAAWAFYSGLFGWTRTEQMDMGEMGIYQMFGNGAHPVGGMYDRPPEMPVTSWLYYIRVPDLDAALEKVRSHGGQVLNGPMEVPGGDRVAQCLDPQGAAFALHGSAAG